MSVVAIVDHRVLIHSEGVTGPMGVVNLLWTQLIVIEQEEMHKEETNDVTYINHKVN